jgi:general secretion pathway protein H
MNRAGWSMRGIAGAVAGVARAGGGRGAFAAARRDTRSPARATRHVSSALAPGGAVTRAPWTSARQHDGNGRGPFPGVGRGDGDIGAQGVSARQPTCLERSPFAGIGAGDGPTGVRWMSARQPPRLVRTPFAGIGGGDGLTGMRWIDAWQPSRLLRSPFIGVSRGDGIIGAQRVSARQRGFSLLEMLLVMALIAATGLLAAGVLTGGFDRMALRSGAKDIAAQLRFARAHAIATGVPQQFQVDPAARTWQGADGRAGELPGEVRVRFTGAREVQPAAGIGAIVFFGDGASTGGRVQLSLGDAAWNVDVAWLTGEVTLRRGEVAR